MFVGLLQREMVVDFEMEVDVDPVPVLVQADIVHAHLVPVGYGPDPLGLGLALDLARVGVNDDVGAGSDALDAGFHRFGDGVGPLKGQIAVHVHGHVDEDAGPGSPEPDMADAQYALERAGGIGDLLGQPVGRPVQQDIHGPLAELVADEQDDERDPQRGGGVGLL